MLWSWCTSNHANNFFLSATSNLKGWSSYNIHEFNIFWHVEHVHENRHLKSHCISIMSAAFAGAMTAMNATSKNSCLPLTACPPQLGSSNGTATASNTQRLVPCWQTKTGSNSGTATTSNTQRPVPSWQTRSGNSNEPTTASSTPRPMHGWQTRSGNKSGAATASNRWRPMPGWQIGSGSKSGTATASGTGKCEVSKICT